MLFILRLPILFYSLVRKVALVLIGSLLATFRGCSWMPNVFIVIFGIKAEEGAVIWNCSLLWASLISSFSASISQCLASYEFSHSMMMAFRSLSIHFPLLMTRISILIAVFAWRVVRCFIFRKFHSLNLVKLLRYVSDAHCSPVWNISQW